MTHLHLSHHSSADVYHGTSTDPPPPNDTGVTYREVYYTHLPVDLCHWPRTDPPLQSGAESQGVYLV